VGQKKKTIMSMTDAEFKNYVLSAGFGVCLDCKGVVDGNMDGWYDSAKYGELSVCEDCSCKGYKCWTCAVVVGAYPDPPINKVWRDALDEYEYTCDKCFANEYPNENIKKLISKWLSDPENHWNDITDYLIDDLGIKVENQEDDK